MNYDCEADPAHLPALRGRVSVSSSVAIKGGVSELDVRYSGETTAFHRQVSGGAVAARRGKSRMHDISFGSWPSLPVRKA